MKPSSGRVSLNVGASDRRDEPGVMLAALGRPRRGFSGGLPAVACAVAATLLLVASGSAPAAAPALPWPAPVRKVHAIASDGPRAFLATGDNHAELVVVDVETGATLGTFDAAGPADAVAVKVVAPGVVQIGRRPSAAPEVYLLYVANPANIVVLATGESARTQRWKPDPLPPVRFADVNDDGIYRLACLGDSNTVPATGLTTWCELLAATLGVDVVNVAAAGATVTPAPDAFFADAAQQLVTALDAAPDAVVLAFGTNDLLRGKSVDQILDAYVTVAQQATAAGVAVFVAATPPLGGCSGAGCGPIFELNQRLADAFPRHVIDFFGGFGDADFGPADQIHLNQAGQVLRAERACAVIASPLLGTGRACSSLAASFKDEGSREGSDAVRRSP